MIGSSCYTQLIQIEVNEWHFNAKNTLVLISVLMMPFRENVLMPFLLMTRNMCGKDAAKAMSSEWVGGAGGAAIKERNKKVDDPHKQTMICILSCFSKSASELIC